MVSFFKSNWATRVVEDTTDTAILDDYQEEKLRDFLGTLAPDQMTLLLQTGAVVDMIVGNENVKAPEGTITFPLESEHRAFDFEEWKNDPNHSIR